MQRNRANKTKENQRKTICLSARIPAISAYDVGLQTCQTLQIDAVIKKSAKEVVVEDPVETLQELNPGWGQGRGLEDHHLGEQSFVVVPREQIHVPVTLSSNVMKIQEVSSKS